MSIESITERILKEAQAYSDSQRSEAEAVKAETLKEAQAEADKLLQKFEAEAKNDAEVLVSRRQSVADLDARKMKLAAKQSVIDECYKKAVDMILNLEAGEYVKFICRQLGAYQKEGGEVLLNQSDRDRIGADLVKLFEGTALTLSDETADIEGGCILRRGNISYNASLEKLLSNAREELTAEVAGILFK